MNGSPDIPPPPPPPPEESQQGPSLTPQSQQASPAIADQPPAAPQPSMPTAPAAMDYTTPNKQDHIAGGAGPAPPVAEQPPNPPQATQPPAGAAAPDTPPPGSIVTPEAATLGNPDAPAPADTDQPPAPPQPTQPLATPNTPDTASLTPTNAPEATTTSDPNSPASPVADQLSSPPQIDVRPEYASGQPQPGDWFVKMDGGPGVQISGSSEQPLTSYHTGDGKPELVITVPGSAQITGDWRSAEQKSNFDVRLVHSDQTFADQPQVSPPKPAPPPPQRTQPSASSTRQVQRSTALAADQPPPPSRPTQPSATPATASPPQAGDSSASGAALVANPHAPAPPMADQPPVPPQPTEPSAAPITPATPQSGVSSASGAGQVANSNASAPPTADQPPAPPPPMPPTTPASPGISPSASMTTAGATTVSSPNATAPPPGNLPSVPAQPGVQPGPPPSQIWPSAQPVDGRPGFWRSDGVGAPGKVGQQDFTKQLEQHGLFFVQDPPPTDFEKKLQSGQPFSVRITPPPDIDPRQAYWLGQRPTDAELDHMRFEPTGNLAPSTKIWVPGTEPQSSLTVSQDNTIPLRDSKTHELLGYLHRDGETVDTLDRDGNLLSSRGIEEPLERDAVDPIDVLMALVDPGDLIGGELGAATEIGVEDGVKATIKVATSNTEAATTPAVRTAGDVARQIVDRYAGRLVDSGGALRNIIERARDPALRVDGRAAANELRGMLRVLEEGIDGKVAAQVEVIPSSSAGRTPDLAVHFADGTSTRFEMRALTSAPSGRVVPKPDLGPGSLARGLADSTLQRPVSASDITKAIVDKATITPSRPNQLTSVVPGVNPGGTISINVTHASANPAMIDAAVRRAVASGKLGVDVQRIEVTYLLPRVAATDPLTRGTMTYLRQPSGTYLRTP